MPRIPMIIACCLFFLPPGRAAAQSRREGDFFIGYSFENSNASVLNLNGSRPNWQGWEASLEGKLVASFGMVADFSSHYGSQTYTQTAPSPANVNVTGRETEILFGPRVSVPLGKVQIFGELEGGLGHVRTNTFGSDVSWATAVGGGIDLRLATLVAWRFQGDYVSTHVFHAPQDDVRLSTGIVLRF